MAFHDPLLNGATISALRAVPLLEARGWSFSFWVPAPGPCFDWLAERGAEVEGEFRPIVSGLRGLREPPGPARRLLGAPGYLRRFAGAVKRADPRLVHANSLFTYAEALTAQRLLRRPTLLHVHDMIPSGKPREARAVCRRGVSRCVAVSRACAASYAHDGWAPDMVYEAAPIPAEVVPIREAPEPFVIATVGVVAPRKGGDLFVAAARELQRTHPGRFEFRLIGAPNDPHEREWGERVIAEARAAGVVHRPEADVLAEMSGWDAFVLPSRSDPCPLVMLEAMASGLPVIGTRCDGIGEQITEDCGRLVEMDNAGELAAAILAVSRLSAQERARMGGAGRRRVESVFSLDAQADGLHRIYTEMAPDSPL
jgi:glycosyltransferase involved in cell wall biosynthesis